MNKKIVFYSLLMVFLLSFCLFYYDTIGLDWFGLGYALFASAVVVVIHTAWIFICWDFVDRRYLSKRPVRYLSVLCWAVSPVLLIFSSILLWAQRFNFDDVLHLGLFVVNAMVHSTLYYFLRLKERHN